MGTLMHDTSLDSQGILGPLLSHVNEGPLPRTERIVLDAGKGQQLVIVIGHETRGAFSLP